MNVGNPKVRDKIRRKSAGQVIVVSACTSASCLELILRVISHFSANPERRIRVSTGGPMGGVVGAMPTEL